MTKFNLHTVRTLADKYFEASITREESDILREAATEIIADPGSLPDEDPRLFSDIQVIASIFSCMDSETAEISGSAPAGLEMMLDKHISTLARKSRASIFRRVLIPVASCAAVAAILLTIGINLRTDSDDTLLQPLQPATSSITAMVTASDTVAASPATVLPVEAPNQIATASAAPSVRKRKSPTPQIHTVSLAKPEILPAIQPATITTAKLPEVPEFITDITSMVAAASIDPTKVMIQPITTYSQVVFNVCETADLVSEAFSGISQTLAMVSHSISTAEPAAE